MNIGIIQCDQIDEELRSEHGTYSEMYATLLHQVDPHLRFFVYDVRYGELPTHIDAVDAYLITGSRHGVHDDFSWIGDLEEFIRRLLDARKKIIGICFGHQLIAKALGGTVIKSPKGWGIGMSVQTITQHKSWMFPPLEELHLLVSHQDQVVKIPKEVEVLASSDFCPFYMLHLKDCLLTVQGHPEFTKTYTHALIEKRKSTLGKKLSEGALHSLKQKSDDTVFAHWMVHFLRHTTNDCVNFD